MISNIYYVLRTYYRFVRGLLNLNFQFEKIWLFFSIRRNTLVSVERMDNLYKLVEKVDKNGIKGDLVECGVWKGGCVAIMAYVRKKIKSKKKIWMFDSFEGLPEPSKKDGLKAKSYAGNKDQGKLTSIDQVVASLSDVKKIFCKLNISWKNIKVEKGWFQNTLPKTKIKQIALLRLDGDWYESTKICLQYLYKLVSNGGYIIIDDYYRWEGCTKAVDEFFDKNNIKIKLVKIDNESAYFKKI